MDFGIPLPVSRNPEELFGKTKSSCGKTSSSATGAAKRKFPYVYTHEDIHSSPYEKLPFAIKKTMASNETARVCKILSDIVYEKITIKIMTPR
ncbi:hypothetical protein FYJ75_04050 [Roseburia sp. MUC/MUC-530-WT-4D]|uniref:Uncharacterized protein n=1 Tax=Roseburia porci TaxID=2605790 RepID=A0A6L5YP86_9FIRM|nr:hypothetical protein [Roseburia porci]